VSDFKYPADRVTAFELAAVYRSDVDAMHRFFQEDPDVFRKLRERKDRVFCDATRESSIATIKTLITLGADVNEQDSNGNSALCLAVRRDRYKVAKMLLECGADADLDCPLFRVGCFDLKDPIAMAKLLLDFGADINQPYLVEGWPPRNVLSEAMEKGRTKLVDFLESRGAKLPGDEDAAEHPKGPTPEPAAGDYSADILSHFRTHFGQPDKRVIREIVPTSEYPVVIHYIPPSANQQDSEAVLFTVGLHQFAMSVPAGAERFCRAELMLRLHKSWPPPQKAVKDRRWAWPIQWLRKIARYPVENNTWLGAEWTVLTEEEPPQPVGPGTTFTAWLLTSLPGKEDVVKCKDGTTIQIYHLFPLYTEEYYYERKHGVEALMTLFIEHETQMHIDPNRPNVAAGKV
jgi:hypothetical protein